MSNRSNRESILKALGVPRKIRVKTASKLPKKRRKMRKRSRTGSMTII